jgi:V/A-type H+/Na+-transporting ATPase subunit E
MIMAEELQHLIDRIKGEAVEAGQKKADELVSQAREKAAEIVSKAERDAKAKLEQAEKDSEVYTERSRKALEQAARDLLITVGQGVENILADLVAESLDEALNIEVLEQMLVKMAAAKAEQPNVDQVELLVSESDQSDLVKFFAAKYKEKMIHGIQIHTDNEILKGFKVSLQEGRVYQDFTREAIAEALNNFLRPHLSEIVSRVAKEQVEGEEE